MRKRSYGARTRRCLKFVAGWKITTYAYHTEIIAEKIMAEWTSGYPAAIGLARAMDALASAGKRTVDGELFSIDHLAMEGDPFAKVAGVYTGNNTPTLAVSRH